MAVRVLLSPLSLPLPPPPLGLLQPLRHVDRGGERVEEERRRALCQAQPVHVCARVDQQRLCAEVVLRLVCREHVVVASKGREPQRPYKVSTPTSGRETNTEDAAEYGRIRVLSGASWKTLRCKNACILPLGQVAPRVWRGAVADQHELLEQEWDLRGDLERAGEIWGDVLELGPAGRVGGLEAARVVVACWAEVVAR